MSLAPGIQSHLSREIYSFVRDKVQVTKADIATNLGLSLPTVNKYVAHFLESGFLRKAAKLAPGSHGGRSPVAYALVPDARVSIGLDVRSTHVTSVLVDLDREVRASRRIPHPFERTDDYLRFLAGEVHHLVDTSGLDRSRVLGVTIAMPGLIDTASQEVIYGRVIDNVGMTATELGRHIDLPTRLVHDSDAAGLAEFTPRHDSRNAFYMSLGHSVGGSALINGVVFVGDGVFSAEIGHVRVSDDGPTCYCGQQGCFDAHCNATVLAGLADGSLELFFQRVDAGEPTASTAWERYTDHLARGIHDVRALFGCTIILGGDVGTHLADRMPAVHAKVDALRWLGDEASDYVVPANRLSFVISTGAALFRIEEFLDQPDL